jgi:hypothetical protein
VHDRRVTLRCVEPEEGIVSVNWLERPDEFVAQEPAALAAGIRLRRRDPRVAWGTWMVFGLLGAHRFYLRAGRGALVVPLTALALAALAVARPRLRARAVGALLALWVLEGALLTKLIAADRDRAEREALRQIEAQRDSEWRIEPDANE